MRYRIGFILAGAGILLASILLDPRALAASAGIHSWFFSEPLFADLRVAFGSIGLILPALPWFFDFLRRTPRGIRAAGPEIAFDATGTPGRARRLTRPIDLLLVSGLIAGAAAVCVRNDPVTTDTKYFLGEAIDIAAQGGPGGLLARCFRGTWAEDNRHPLYLGMLAPFAEPSNRFLESARLVSMSGAILTLLVCLRACRRRGGETAAICGGVLLVTNGAFLEQAVTVGCESWWTAFAVGALDLATRDEARSRLGTWPGFGALLGLAYLTKGTTVVLLLASVVWLFAREGRRAWRPLVAACTAFVLVASPLLVRNQLRFGDPFWNIASRRVFWLDHWGQFFDDPKAMHEAGALHYLKTHSLPEIASRLGLGMVKVAVHALEACSPLVPRAAFGVPVLAILVLGIATLPDRRTRSFLIGFCTLWILSFAWYAQITSDRRFLAVLLPMSVPVIAGVTNRLDERGRSLVGKAGLAVAGLVACAQFASGGYRFRIHAFAPASSNEELHAFLHEQTAGNRLAVYLMGPSRGLGFDWDPTLPATRRSRPESDSDLRRWIAESNGEHVRWLVVESPGSVDRVGDGWVRAGEDGSLRAGTVPADWTLLGGIPPSAPRVLVFGRR
jgi:Dolichyl-phosphate-mannose-protein mannosyltransferase